MRWKRNLGQFLSWSDFLQQTTSRDRETNLPRSYHNQSLPLLRNPKVSAVNNLPTNAVSETYKDAQHSPEPIRMAAEQTFCLLHSRNSRLEPLKQLLTGEQYCLVG